MIRTLRLKQKLFLLCEHKVNELFYSLALLNKINNVNAVVNLFWTLFCQFWLELFFFWVARFAPFTQQRRKLKCCTFRDKQTVLKLKLFLNEGDCVFFLKLPVIGHTDFLEECFIQSWLHVKEIVHFVLGLVLDFVKGKNLLHRRNVVVFGANHNCNQEAK